MDLIERLIEEADGYGDGPVVVHDIEGLRALLREAAAALEAARGDVWQPIETAPRGGREMILLLTPSRFPQVAFSNTWWTAGFSVECKPTHWMPLPAHPKENDHA